VDDITGTYTLGPDSGRVILKTARAGLAARAGHDLTIEVTRWSAVVTGPDAAAPGSTAGDVTVTAELDLGSVAVRAGSGGAKPLTDRDRRDIESTARKILGGGGDARARFVSSAVTPSGTGGVIEGTLALNGTARPSRLQVTSTGPLQFQASAVVRQTDHGITPYSGFFGALKLRDDVGVEVEADLNKAARQ
jgi:hypothetical protein